MRHAIGLAILGVLLLVGACAPPQPVVIVVTATPPPPTATPFVIIITATPAPATETPPPTATQPAAATALPTQTLVPPTATPNIPTKAPPPPPPPPTATPFLPQLAVFDQGGGNMDVYLFGGQTGKFLNFRAVACAPNCNNRPDGRDVNNVYFTVFRRTPQNTLQWVFDSEEQNAPFCIFGGSNQCPYLNISDPNVKWPGTNTVIANGDYVLRVEANGKNNATWNGRANFKVNR
ncbi:MAG: hypothetical protein HY868_18940 [Chloroflexi bacterium]|nr:hypothetical protein [Chloroflexota bacterium]